MTLFKEYSFNSVGILAQGVDHNACVIKTLKPTKVYGFTIVINNLSDIDEIGFRAVSKALGDYETSFKKLYPYGDLESIEISEKNSNPLSYEGEVSFTAPLELNSGVDFRLILNISNFTSSSNPLVDLKVKVSE